MEDGTLFIIFLVLGFISWILLPVDPLPFVDEIVTLAGTIFYGFKAIS